MSESISEVFWNTCVPMTQRTSMEPPFRMYGRREDGREVYAEIRGGLVCWRISLWLDDAPVGMHETYARDLEGALKEAVNALFYRKRL